MKTKLELHCSKCEEVTEHIYVQTPTTFSGDDSWKYSCRGIRPDYRTCKCLKCNKVTTWDFATD